MENSFIYALTTEERVKALKEEKGLLRTDGIFLDRWRNIRGLSTVNDLEHLLASRDMTLEEFTYVIKPFNKIDKKILEDFLVEQEWYISIKKIINNYFSSENKLEKELKSDVSYTVRPFLNDFILFLKNFKNDLENRNLFINDTVVSDIISHAANLLMTNPIKIVTYDLHLFKEENESESIYENYLNAKYGTKEMLESFYSEYPVMTRLTVERLMMLKAHIKKSFSALIDNVMEIKAKLNIEVIGNTVKGIDLGAGDTHEQGQSVVIYTFEHNQKIVYKPKNLKIERAFFEFIGWINGQAINDSDVIDLPVLDAIYKENYTLSVYVENFPCHSEDEIKEYYRRMGELLLLLYLLGGNDFHYENIIANGNMPYIVDIETLFQLGNSILEDGGTVEEKIDDEVINSVLALCILPILGLQQNKEGVGIDISALNAKQQQSPFKILQMKNPNSSEMKFEYDYFEFKDGCSIPTLNGSKVSFARFTDDLKQGFANMAKFVLENKDEVSLKVSSIFKSNILVRQLTKATSSYATLMQYSNHPNYLKDMFYLEKLLDNFCSYLYKDKRIFSAEIDDMLRGDIPIFYSKLSSKAIITSQGISIEDYFEELPIDISLNRIKAFNHKEMEKQLNYISLSLNEFDEINEAGIKQINKKGNCIQENISGKYDFKSEAVNITNKIIESTVWNDKKDDINWISIAENQNSISALTPEYSTGLSGLGVYFHVLSEIFDNDLYVRLSSILKKKTNIFEKENLDLKITPQYINNAYLSDINYLGSNELSYIERREKKVNLKLLADIVNDKSNSRYYLDVLLYLYNTYQLDKKDDTLNNLIEFTELLYSKDLLTCNLLLFNKLKKYVPAIEDDITQCINQFEKLEPHKIWDNSNVDGYQNGLTSQINILIDLYIISKKNDFLKKATILTEAMLKSYEVNKRFRIYEIDGYENVPLDKGLAGIAYTLLRLVYKERIPNIFCLELKERC